MTSLAVDASVRRPTSIRRKTPIIASLTCWRLPCLMAMFRRHNSSRNGLRSPDVQSLLLKVRVRPDKSFTARFPAEFPGRITVRLKNSQSFSREVSDYPGFPTRPFTWEEISVKFDKLVAGHVGAQLSQDIKVSVRSLEYMQVSDLTKLLRELN
jgi:2-methylcitrate dehydratase PrpD